VGAGAGVLVVGQVYWAAAGLALVLYQEEAAHLEDLKLWADGMF